MLKNRKLLSIFLFLTIFVSNLFAVYHRIGGIDIDPSISQTTKQMEVDQDIVYCLVAQKLQIYDIQDISNPELISEINIIGSPKHFAINDNFIFISTYIGSYEVGCFIIVDINDINNPIIIYEYYTYSSNGYYYPKKTEIINGYACVDYYDPITWESKFIIFDISNPFNTTLISILPHRMEVLDFEVVNNFCYLFGWGQGDCIILDISDPVYPFILNTYYNLESIHTVEIIENIAYCCSGTDFRIYDFTDPFNIFLISELDGIYDSNSLFIDQNRAFIATGSQGMLVIDISDIENPSLLEVYDSNNSTNYSALYVTVSDNIAYLTDRSSDGFLFIDVSDTYNSHLINQYNGTFHENSISSYDNILVFVEDETIYFFDITDIENPIQLYSHFAAGYSHVVYATQNYVFDTSMLHNVSSLYVYDISNPDNIHRVGLCNVAEGDRVHAMSLNDNFLYLATGYNQGLFVYEISPNNDLVFVTSYDEYLTSTIEIQDDIAYISTTNGLGILDVSDPNNVFLLNEWQTSDYIKSILINNGILYLLLYDNKLYLVDIIDIYNPIILSDILPHNSSEISPNYFIEDNELIFSDLNWNELFVYDVNNPEEPVLDSSLRWNLKSVDLIVYDNGIITANKSYGLSFLRMANFTNIQESIPEIMILNVNNYPNPFNPETKIVFDLPESGQVKLEIYNIKGQKIKSLLNDQIAAGEHSIIWNGEDTSEKKVSSGVYLYKLNVNGKTESIKKCLLLK